MLDEVSRKLWAFPMSCATRKPSFMKHFAVDFPKRAEWKTGELLEGYDTVFFTDGSKMVLEVTQHSPVDEIIGDTGSLLMAVS